MLIRYSFVHKLNRPKRLLVSKTPFQIVESGKLLKFGCHFGFMHIRLFPLQEFLGTFSMVFWGPHINALCGRDIASDRNASTRFRGYALKRYVQTSGQNTAIYASPSHRDIRQIIDAHVTTRED